MAVRKWSILLPQWETGSSVGFVDKVSKLGLHQVCKSEVLEQSESCSYYKTNQLDHDGL